jgi:hypothetical protein
MVSTIVFWLVVFVVSFALTPVDKVVAIFGWFGRVADKGKDKLVSRSKEWKDAFSKPKGKIEVVEDSED